MSQVKGEGALPSLLPVVPIPRELSLVILVWNLKDLYKEELENFFKDVGKVEYVSNYLSKTICGASSRFNCSVGSQKRTWHS